MRKWKSRLTSGAMKTQTCALIRIGEVFEVTATVPLTPEEPVARGLAWAGTCGTKPQPEIHSAEPRAWAGT